MQHFDQAVDSLTVYVAYCPDSAKGYYLRAKAYQAIHIYDMALVDFKKANELRPSDLLQHHIHELEETIEN